MQSPFNWYFLLTQPLLNAKIEQIKWNLQFIHFITFMQISLLTGSLVLRRAFSSCLLQVKLRPFLNSSPNSMFWSFLHSSASPERMIFLDPSMPMDLNSYVPLGTKQTHWHLGIAQSQPWKSSSWMEPIVPLLRRLSPKFIKLITFLFNSFLFYKTEK